MKELFQHAATTDGITVRVTVNFLPEQSQVEAGKWFWVYHIRIENHAGKASINAALLAGLRPRVSQMLLGKAEDFLRGLEI
jgi:hypothetical protein